MTEEAHLIDPTTVIDNEDEDWIQLERLMKEEAAPLPVPPINYYYNVNGCCHLPAATNLSPTDEEQDPPRKKARNDASLDNDVEVLENHEEATNYLEERKLLRRKKTALEKIKLMVELDGQKNKGKLTNPAINRIFVSRYVNPTMECLNNHFGGKVQAFADVYPGYLHTTFKDYCCGAGDVCSPN